MEGTDGTTETGVGLLLLGICVEQTLPDADIFFRDAGVCGSERAYSLLGEGVRPLRTDGPASPLQAQWPRPHIQHSPASGRLRFSVQARPSCLCLCDQVPTVSLNFLICPPQNLTKFLIFLKCVV